MAIDSSIEITVIVDVLLDKPVGVVTSADATIFPASWQKEPILAPGEALPKQKIDRARTNPLPCRVKPIVFKQLEKPREAQNNSQTNWPAGARIRDKDLGLAA